MEVSVSFGKQTAVVALPSLSATCADLAAELEHRFGQPPLALHTIKLLVPKKGVLHLAEHGDEPLAAAGVHPGAKLKMIASHAADVAAVQAAQDDRLMPGFDADLRRELRRAGKDGGDGTQLPAGPYTFQKFEAWQRPGLVPPPSEALKLLHRLAADPGIVGVMREHRWAVGLLSEMPPEGKVGVSPVCILGVNINRGQEISLRLRTDDLKGFRRYDRIRETLLHELAHMVWGDHDINFKQLNSQLRRECDSFDWRGAAARSLAGAAFEGTVRYDLPPERQTVMQQTAASSGQTAGGGAAPADARQAAAEAALRRAGAGGAGAEPASQQQRQRAALQQPFKKGDKVLYRQRDGSMEEATVVSVDLSVQPPSYGVQLASGVRETEHNRLAPLPAAGGLEPEEVEGLGHRDAATEEKEEAARRLEQ